MLSAHNDGSPSVVLGHPVAAALRVQPRELLDETVRSGPDEMISKRAPNVVRQARGIAGASHPSEESL